MLIFSASVFVEEGTIVLKLNGAEILNKPGKVDMEIEKGKKYEVSWEVKAKAGNSYTLSISSPKEAEYHLTKVLPVEGTDHQEHQFSI